jgi:hypothetical protein
MALRMIARAQWRVFCDRVSKGLAGQRAETVLTSPGLGSEIQAEWLPLLGIAYDPKSDVIEIGLAGLGHRVRQPHQLYADEGPAGLAALVIIDDEGVRHEIKLREPVRLRACLSDPHEPRCESQRAGG